MTVISIPWLCVGFSFDSRRGSGVGYSVTVTGSAGIKTGAVMVQEGSTACGVCSGKSNLLRNLCHSVSKVAT